MSSNPCPPMQSKTHFWSWLMLAASIALADQFIKWTVQSMLAYGQSIPITTYFNWVHQWNTGAAFSFLAGAGGWQRYFLIGVALLVSIVLTTMLRRPLPWLEAGGYSLILGGALGNVIDRLVHGYVVDYLDFHWQDLHWPAFNLADIGISLGAVLLIYTAFRGDRSSSALDHP